MASTRVERAARGRSFASVAGSGGGGELRAARAPVADELSSCNGSEHTLALADRLLAGLQPSAAAERGRAELIAAVRATLAPAFPGVLVRARSASGFALLAEDPGLGLSSLTPRFASHAPARAAARRLPPSAACR
jgi:hypothetical protein